MKRLYVVALCVAVVGCTEAVEVGEPELAVDPLIGKRLVGERATFLFNADGTVGGTFDGNLIVGTYTSDAQEICSEYTAPENFVNLKPCSKPAINGDTVVFNRRDGSRSATYRIE